MSDHPMLRDPERLQAFELLLANPKGTFREWAALLGWPLPRLQRFLASLEREALVVVTTTRWGSLLARYTPDTPPIQPPDTHPVRARYTPDTSRVKALEQLPRSRAGSDLAADLIDCMNAGLGVRFSDYRIVLYDNRSSNATATRFLKLRIDAEWAARDLAQSIRLFQPEKHGKGQLPRSLSFFEPKLVAHWKDRGQQEMALLTLERGKKGPEPVASALEAYMAGAERKQGRA
jgi:hypothetical protein